MGHMMNGPFGGLWILWMVLIVSTPMAAIGLAIMWIRRDSPHRNEEARPQVSPGDEAIEQLKSRYANGKIDDEEFERRVESLLRN